MNPQQPLTWLIVNTSSGSYSAQAVADLETRFEEAGYPLGRIVELPDDDVPEVAALDAAGVDLLAIYTGDGSINWVLTNLYGWTGQVLILHGGTQNLLAKALHGDVRAEQVIEALGAGDLTPTTRHLIRCSQGDALCEIVAGPGAHWSDVREAMREGDLAAMASTLGEAISQTTSEGAPVRVTRPVLGKPEGYPALRVYPAEGQMIVDGYGAETLAEYAQQGLALIRRDFREGPHDELGPHPSIVCRADGPIELMIDGERRTGGEEERFELFECPVEFLALNGQREQP